MPEDCRRFPKTNEEVRPLPKMSEEPFKHLTVFSPETVNIKKLANLTVNTKNYGQITPNIKPHSDLHDCIFNNYSSSPNGLWVKSHWLRAHEGERNNCFSKIQLVDQKYRDKTTLAGKTRFSCHCFGFQRPRFLLLVGYNIEPSNSSTNQNAALIIDH